ncbi:hypothetical protein HRbin14_01598 [bacterium HR14]|nr:hypothetical protein HRbin14_01598 [bacterium HR14]
MSELLKALQARAKVRYENPPRKVLAFYYGWYGNPSVSGRWLHWERVDAERKTIATSTHYPQLGAYDSSDPKVIEQHCRWAREAGLDGFIFSWWGKGGYEEKPLSQLLQSAQQHRLQVCIYYEAVPEPGNPETALADWEYILRRYGAHPAYLKVDGKPVIFVYARAMEQLSMSQWALVLAEIARRSPPGVCAIADRLDKTACRIFDGVHTYNTAGALAGKPLEQVEATTESQFREAFQQAGALFRIRCATVIPGYDDTKIRTPGLAVARYEGRSYREQWEAALRLNPDWVLITSFNEWHEGSEIEPSVEHGDRYLKLTAEYARQFQELPPAPRMATPLTALPPDAITALRKRWQGKTIGVLPDASSEAFFWLIEAGLPIALLEWEQVVEPGRLTPQHYEALVYAGGESYRASVRQPNDVDGALRAYLQAGGRLLALSYQPFPFYYADGKAVGDARRFGLPIAGSSPNPQAGTTGFEQPPVPNLRFFWNRTLMPYASAEPTPFPEGGDQRWRPMLRSLVSPEDEYLPLITLRDGQGRSWGEGAGIVRYRTGALKGAAVGYAWFRLLEMPQAPLLLEALFRLIL